MDRQVTPDQVVALLMLIADLRMQVAARDEQITQYQETIERFATAGAAAS